VRRLLVLLLLFAVCVSTSEVAYASGLQVRAAHLQVFELPFDLHCPFQAEDGADNGHPDRATGDVGHEGHDHGHEPKCPPQSGHDSGHDHEPSCPPQSSHGSSHGSSHESDDSGLHCGHDQSDDAPVVIGAPSDPTVQGFQLPTPVEESAPERDSAG